MSQISVVIPTYNRLALLSRCLDSVVQQSHAAVEVIVVDDGSTDGSAEFIASQYPNVILIRQQNCGVSVARNRGIQQAKGDWIALLDSDDEWLPNKLARQHALIDSKPNAVLVHTEEIWIRNGIRVNAMKKHQKRGGEIYPHCLPLCCISPSSVIMRREALLDLGLFDESLPACEDYDLWLRLCSRWPVEFIEEPLLIKYGGHEDQLSQQYWGMDRFRIYALNKILDKNNLTEKQRELTVDMLIKKLRIFLKGARKHKNSEYVEEFSQLLYKYTQE